MRRLTVLMSLAAAVAALAVSRRPQHATDDVRLRFAASADDGFARALAPRPFVLPEDHGPHFDYQTEWWYFNGHLTDEDGGRYALHDVVFQVVQLASRRTLYVRQIGLAEASSGRHVSGERLLTREEPLTSEPGSFAIGIGDGAMSGQDGQTYRLIASAEGWTYDLTLTNAAPSLIHDDDGLVDLGEAGVTYYYSRPRLDVTGTLDTGAGPRRVTGLAWLDKQWGNFQPIIVYWDWASIQLDDGMDMMVTNLRGQRQQPIDRYATLRRPGGDVVRIGGDGFAFEPLSDTWTSERTGTTYNTRWRVTVPGEGIDVTLEPMVAASEFASGLLGVVYWEAGVDVVDAAGVRVGQGFVELNWARTFGPSAN